MLDDQRFHDGARLVWWHHGTERRKQLARGHKAMRICDAPQDAPDRSWCRDRQDRQGFTIYGGGWAVGRIYETRGGPDHLRWFWSFTVTCPMTRSDWVSTLEEAKVQF